LKLVFQNEKQFFDVLMLFEQDISDLWHWRTSIPSPINFPVTGTLGILEAPSAFLRHPRHS
ncbi:hypothetical protein, partial [Bradyrhizobium sp.]|uniref:hypothetical protein n=1 Tax=Bradyrhizobium sp. TaxID=376 RepID=UPI0025C2B167